MKLNHVNAVLRICIDKNNNGQIGGRVFGQRLENTLIFDDLLNFILMIDALLDKQNFPRAFQRRRSFAQQELPSRPPAAEIEGDLMSKDFVEEQLGALATLELSIITRQNTSWQGTIVWQDNKQRQSFKSALEFVRHINKRLEID